MYLCFILSLSPFPLSLPLSFNRYVGPYLHLSSDLCYVLEDQDGPCGYILSALDSLKFYRDFESTWLPTVTRKYPVTSKVNTDEEVSYEV